MAIGMIGHRRSVGKGMSPQGRAGVCWPDHEETLS
jgi:hypothetical protein